MSKFWDNWATKHRNWEVIATAVGVTAILVWGIVQLKSVESVGSTEATAVVKELQAFGAAATGTDDTQVPERNMCIGVLQLEDGATIRMLLVKPLPKPGDKVPLRVEHYNDGSKTYSIDVVKRYTQETD
jgi:hypothetical protein